jgi:hypothetical protein
MMEHISSVTIDPVRPSLSLCYHPEYCRDIPNAVGTQADGTLPRRPPCNSGTSISQTLELAHER